MMCCVISTTRYNAKVEVTIEIFTVVRKTGKTLPLRDSYEGHYIFTLRDEMLTGIL